MGWWQEDANRRREARQARDPERGPRAPARRKKKKPLRLVAKYRGFLGTFDVTLGRYATRKAAEAALGTHRRTEERYDRLGLEPLYTNIRIEGGKQ